MPDRIWKREAREVPRLARGRCHPASSHVGRLPVAQLEALMQAAGPARGKVGLLVVKRRAGRERAPRAWSL